MLWLLLTLVDLLLGMASTRSLNYFSGVIFAGSPSTCVSILGVFKIGDEVMSNSKIFSAQTCEKIENFLYLLLTGEEF